MGRSVWRKILSEEIKPLKVFVGYDSREDIAFEVCRQSIYNTASVPVEVIPLRQDKLRSIDVNDYYNLAPNLYKKSLAKSSW